MFEAPFTASSVCVSFDHSNTLTLNIPKDASTDGYDIAFNVTPPTVSYALTYVYCSNVHVCGKTACSVLLYDCRLAYVVFYA